MKHKGLILLGVVVVLLLIVGGTSCGQYNSLVQMEENVDGRWAQVENVLQRRADLIPNLVNTVKGFASQEKEIFTQVAEARSKLIGAKGPEAKAEANARVGSALSRLLMISERYPDLKSNQSFIRLQDELAGTENRISTERRRYNEAVKAYNTKIKQFPTNIMAGMFGFENKEYFEADEGAEEAPEVQFE